MSEADYDAEIAPELLRLANRCKELGMPFTATVEYAPGSRSTTAADIENDNLDMLVAYLAGRTGAKLDDLMFAVARRVNELELPHSCICLESIGVPCDPAKRTPRHGLRRAGR